MLHAALLIAITIFVSDLGDKTQLALIFLTHKTKKHLQLLYGTLLAFLLVNILSIATATIVSHVLPTHIIKIASGITFILFGLLSFKPEKEEHISLEKKKRDSPFFSSLSIIFLSEFGDKSQIATALFATKYDPILVLISSMVGLTLISIITIYLAKKILGKIHHKTITLIGGILFIIIGVLFLLTQ